MQTIESEDQSGNFENGDSKKRCVDTQKQIHAFDMNVPQPSYSQRMLPRVLQRNLSRKIYVFSVASCVLARTSVHA